MELAEASRVFETDVNLDESQITKTRVRHPGEDCWPQQAGPFPDLGDPESRVLLQVPI